MAQSLRYQAPKQGGPFELVKVPKPAIEADEEVLVKIKAVALQPIDWKKVFLGVMVSKWPVILGVDGAGVVEAVGAGVKDFKPGDEVYGRFSGNERNATFQEYAISNANSLAKKSPSLSFEDAASLPVGFYTACTAVYEKLGIPLPFLVQHGGLKDGFRPKSVLILGGSSSVGASAIQILRVALPDAALLTTSSSKHDARLKSLGVDKTFERSATIDEIKAAAPGGNGVDAILDTVNAAALRPELLDALDSAGPKKVAEIATGQNLKEIPPGVDHKLVMGGAFFNLPETQRLWRELESLIQTGQFKVPTDVRVVGEGFESFETGLKQLKDGVSGEKLVVLL